MIERGCVFWQPLVLSLVFLRTDAIESPQIWMAARNTRTGCPNEAIQHRGNRLRQQQVWLQARTPNEFYLKLSLRVPAFRLVTRVSCEEAMGLSPILGYSSGPSRAGYRHLAYVE